MNFTGLSRWTRELTTSHPECYLGRRRPPTGPCGYRYPTPFWIASSTMAREREIETGTDGPTVTNAVSH
jgi:hypothetical protein